MFTLSRKSDSIPASPALGYEITAAYFQARMGYWPDQFELELVNEIGQGQGHKDAGWNKECDLPRFMCGNMTKAEWEGFEVYNVGASDGC